MDLYHGAPELYIQIKKPRNPLFFIIAFNASTVSFCVVICLLYKFSVFKACREKFITKNMSFPENNSDLYPSFTNTPVIPGKFSDRKNSTTSENIAFFQQQKAYQTSSFTSPKKSRPRNLTIRPFSNKLADGRLSTIVSDRDGEMEERAFTSVAEKSKIDGILEEIVDEIGDHNLIAYYHWTKTKF